MSLQDVVKELKQIVQKLDTLDSKTEVVLDKANTVLDKTSPILDTAASSLDSLQRIERILTILFTLLLGVTVIVFGFYLKGKLKNEK